jgi:hypothetical protein
VTARDRRTLEGARAHLRPGSGSSEGERAAARKIVERLERKVAPPRHRDPLDPRSDDAYCRERGGTSGASDPAQRRARAAAYNVQVDAAIARSTLDDTLAIPGWPTSNLLRAIVLTRGYFHHDQADYHDTRDRLASKSWLAPASVAAMMANHDRLATAALDVHDRDQLSQLRAELLRAHPDTGLVLANGYRLWLDDALRRHGLA